MLEAYLGAIFVDSGFDFTVVEAFFTAHVRPFFEDMSLYDTFANKHPTVKELAPLPMTYILTPP
jgi:endoribonuclease Dicer